MNYILSGDEEYLIKKRIGKISEDVLLEQKEYATTYYNGLVTSIFDIIDDANKIALFTDHKVIVVENAFYFMVTNNKNEAVENESKENKNKAINEALIRYLNNSNDYCTLIFVCYGNLDSKKKVVKEALLKCTCEQFKKLEDVDLKKYVSKKLKDEKVVVSDEILNQIMSCLPTDLFQINKELEKLVIYDDKIDLPVIKALLTKPLNDNVFDLTNAIFRNDYTSVFNIWQDFMKLNIEPLMLIGVLATQVRFNFQVAHLIEMGFNDDKLVDELKCKSGRIYNTKKVIGSKKADYFLDILSRLSDVDISIKNGSIDKKIAFEDFMIKLGMR